MSIAGAISSSGLAASATTIRILSALDSAFSGQQATSGPGSLGACRSSEVAQSNSGRTVALLDGEIHNSGDLQSLLSDRPKAAGATLVLYAFERWGVDFIEHLHGDFAIAIWDAGKNSLTLARDHIGSRPLCYWRAQNEVLFASDPRALLTDARVPRELDEDHMAGFLSLFDRDDTRTFYKNIHRVPPGHALIVQPDSTRLHRWWRPERVPELRLRSHEDYAEAVRCSLDEATACRLPATGPAAIALSSGLDSSSIAALAARRLAAQGRGLRAFTLTFSADAAGLRGAGWFADEMPLASQLAAFYPNIDHEQVLSGDAPLLDEAEEMSALRGAPVRAPEVLVAWASLYRRVAATGISNLLTGGFGNMTVSYDGSLFPGSLLRSGRLAELMRLVRKMSRNGVAWRHIANQTLAPNLPPQLHRTVRRLAGAAGNDLFEYSAINPELARRTGVLDLARQRGEGFVQQARGDFRALMLIGLNRLERGPGMQAMRSRYGFITTMPAADRRVVELSLSIPEENFIHQGQPRSLLRTAMTGLVPPAILNERRRGVQGAGWQKAYASARQDFAREVERLEASPLARRCLDVPRLRLLVDKWDGTRLSAAGAGGEDLHVLGRGVAAGQFLRRFEAGTE